MIRRAGSWWVVFVHNFQNAWSTTNIQHEPPSWYWSHGTWIAVEDQNPVSTTCSKYIQVFGSWRSNIYLLRGGRPDSGVSMHGRPGIDTQHYKVCRSISCRTTWWIYQHSWRTQETQWRGWMGWSFATTSGWWRDALCGHLGTPWRSSKYPTTHPPPHRNLIRCWSTICPFCLHFHHHYRWPWWSSWFGARIFATYAASSESRSTHYRPIGTARECFLPEAFALQSNRCTRICRSRVGIQGSNQLTRYWKAPDYVVHPTDLNMVLGRVPYGNPQPPCT